MDAKYFLAQIPNISSLDAKALKEKAVVSSADGFDVHRIIIRMIIRIDLNIVKQIPRKNEKPIVFRNKKYINKSRGQHASLCR